MFLLQIVGDQKLIHNLILDSRIIGQLASRVWKNKDLNSWVHGKQGEWPTSRCVKWHAVLQVRLPGCFCIHWRRHNASVPQLVSSTDKPYNNIPKKYHTVEINECFLFLYEELLSYGMRTLSPSIQTTTEGALTTKDTCSELRLETVRAFIDFF